MFSIKAKGKKLKAKTISELIKQLNRIGLKGKLIPKKGFNDLKFLTYLDISAKHTNQALLSAEQAAQEEAIAQFEADQQEALADYQEAQVALEKEYNEMLTAAEEGIRELHKEEQAMLKAAKEMQEEEMALLASLDEDVEFIFVPKKRK